MTQSPLLQLHKILIPITFDQEHVKDVFLFPISVELKSTSAQETSGSAMEYKVVEPSAHDSIKESFITRYIKDNNLEEELHAPLLHSLSKQISHCAKTVASWQHLINQLPSQYHSKQILVELALQVHMEHWEFTDCICWDLNIFRTGCPGKEAPVVSCDNAFVERLAEQIVRDNSLSVQWTMMISHAIRVQILNKMRDFVSRDSRDYLANYIRELESQYTLNEGNDVTITRRMTDDLSRYQPNLRMLTAKEIREAKAAHE